VTEVTLKGANLKVRLICRKLRVRRQMCEIKATVFDLKAKLHKEVLGRDESKEKVK
jgi:hypothetical protein